MRHILKTVAIALAGLVLAACEAREPATSADAPKGAVVFAAASLTDVLNEIGEHMEAAGLPAPRFSYAGSSALARQIEQGALADVFISADEAWMDYLAGKDLIDPATRKSVLSNTLVLTAPAGAAFELELVPGMDLAGALKGGRLAIAEPDSVPAGKYAREALEALGVWETVKANIVRTENVRAALRFVETGDAAAGIVYATDAKAAGDRVVVVGTFPADTHTPVTYPAALLAGKAGGPGQAFLDYLATPDARQVFEAAGFGLAP